MKKLFIISLSLAMALSLCACGSKTEESEPKLDFSSSVNSSDEKSEIEEATAENEAASAESIAADIDGTDDEKTKIDTFVFLNDESTTIKGKGAAFSDGTLTISKAGTYSIKGTLSDGSIFINTNDEKKVKLLLNGISIYSSETAPIFVENSSKETKIILMNGTVNELSDNAERTTDETDELFANAVIFGKDDIEISGSGTLNIKALFEKGIFSKNDVQISGGVLNIEAVDDGIRGKDGVSVSGGKLSIKCGGDGIRSNSEETDKGKVEISGGEINIISDRDAIQATTDISVSDGNINVKSGGGSTEDIKSKAPEGNFGGFGGTSSEAETSESDTASAKGLKAGGKITVSGGQISLDCFDDAINAGEEAAISSGSIGISTNDDAIHTESSLNISGGTIKVTQCFEGLEGETIAVSDGKVVINASDDGINASSAGDQNENPFGFGGPGDPDEPESSNSSLSISGGKIFIDASGDGIDSNGAIKMTDGLLVIFGPTSNGDTAFDCQANSTVTGGTLLAVGSGGMVEGFGNASAYVSSNTSVPQNTLVSITDSSGKELIAFSSPKDIENILFFTEGMVDGDEITISTGGTHSEKSENGVFLKGETSGAAFLATAVASKTAAGGTGGFGVPGGPDRNP